MPATTCHARWIVPVDSPPIENGAITFDRERIVSIGRAKSPSQNPCGTGFQPVGFQGLGMGSKPSTTVDFGDAVILPGFVNAHTHLELTHLRGRVPFRGLFVRWVEELVAASPADRPDDDPIA